LQLNRTENKVYCAVLNLPDVSSILIKGSSS